nr:acyltransferase family protein [Paenalcaligenes niemegkensis]
MYHLQGTAMDTAAWLRKATSGEPYYHLWYLYMLIGLYLVAPWLRLLYRRTSRRQRFAVLTLVFTLAILQSLHREANSHGYGFFLFWFLPYISYFWAGRMLFDGQLRLAAPVLWLITAVALTAIGTNILSTFETLNLYFYDNFSVTVPLMSLAIFQLLLHTRRLPRLSVIAPLTFGVYLVHPVFLDIATQSGLYGSGSGIVWQAPLIAVLIFILSLAFVGLLRRLPGGTRFS